MKVLIAYSSKYGSTKGIAEYIGQKLKERGMEADVKDVGVAQNLSTYDAFVVGSAVYMGLWMKEAKQFVSQNQSVLSSRPAWLFSSGPVGTKKVDKNGRDILEVSVDPKEMEKLQALVKSRGHKIFFGSLYGSKIKGMAGFIYRLIQKIPSARGNMPEGDFRDWKEIEAWANTIIV